MHMFLVKYICYALRDHSENSTGMGVGVGWRLFDFHQIYLGPPPRTIIGRIWVTPLEGLAKSGYLPIPICTLKQKLTPPYVFYGLI